MQHGVTAVDRPVYRFPVGGVPHHHLGWLGGERAEGPGDPFRSTNQQPHLMAVPQERRGGMRPDQTCTTSDQNLHVCLPDTMVAPSSRRAQRL